jgi:hypothetical protein
LQPEDEGPLAGFAGFSEADASDDKTVAGGTGGTGFDPPLDRTVNTRSSYLAMAGTKLPTWDASILAAPTGPDWILGATVAGIATAALDTTPETVTVVGSRTVARDLADTKVIKIDTAEGSLRYINRERQFDYATDPPRAWDPTSTRNLILGAVMQLGLPTSELDPTGSGLTVDTLGGRGYNAAVPAPGGDQSFELERWLTIDRVVNGLPVHESQVRGVVSNSGQIARLSARWPRFQLRAGLVLRSRQSVLEEIADRLWDDEFGAAITLRAELAYDRVGSTFVPVAVVSIDDTQSARSSSCRWPSYRRISISTASPTPWTTASTWRTRLRRTATTTSSVTPATTAPSSPTRFRRTAARRPARIPTASGMPARSTRADAVFPTSPARRSAPRSAPPTAAYPWPSI